MPVGTILPFTGAIKDIPDKWALCDGLTHSGVITPNLSGRFLEGVTSSPGNTKSAGLPNITIPSGHGLMGWGQNSSGTYGAYQIISKAATHPTGSGNSRWTADFNAHRCSSIYRDDITTVQPNSYTVLYIMKIKA